MTIVPAPGTAAYNDQLAHWDDDKRPQSIAGCAVLLGVSSFAVILRMISQKWFAKGWGIADWLIVAAWLISVGVGVEAIISYTYGFGLHQLRVILEDHSPPHSLVKAFEHGSFVSYAWVPCLACIKLSLLVYYNQLFHVHQKWLKVLSWIMAAFVIAWAIASTPVLIWQCSPIPYFWERMSLMYGIKSYAATHGHCLPQLAHQAAPSITNTFSDCVILIIPIAVLSRLEMPLKKKIGLLILFSLGAFVVATGIVRIYFVFHISNTEDVTWNDVGTVVWTVVETNLGIVCACVPPTMPLVTALAKRMGYGSKSKQNQEPQRRYALGSKAHRNMEKRRQLDSTEEMFHNFVALRSASYSNNGKEADVEVGRMTGEYTPSAYTDSVYTAKPSLSSSRSQVTSTTRSSHVTRPQMAYLGQFQFEHRTPDECGICH